LPRRCRSPRIVCSDPRRPAIPLLSGSRPRWGSGLGTRGGGSAQGRIALGEPHLGRSPGASGHAGGRGVRARRAAIEAYVHRKAGNDRRLPGVRRADLGRLSAWRARRPALALDTRPAATLADEAAIGPGRIQTVPMDTQLRFPFRGDTDRAELRTLFSEDRAPALARGLGRARAGASGAVWSRGRKWPHLHAHRANRPRRRAGDEREITRL